MTNKQRVSKTGLRRQQFAAATHDLWNPPTATLEGKPQSDTAASIDWRPESTGGASTRPREVTSSGVTPNLPPPPLPHLHTSLGRRFFLRLWRSETGPGPSAADTTQRTAFFQQLCQPRSALGVGLASCQGGHLTPPPDTWQTEPSRLCGVLTLSTTVVTDSVDTGMLLAYIYTQHMWLFSLPLLW